MAELKARVKLSMEIPAEMASKIVALKDPLQMPMTDAVRNLLTIGIQAVHSEHNGSLGAAMESMHREGE